MATSNRLFGNISTIYMATAQSTIFWLLRNSHLATAHHPIIYLLQIDQLFYHWKSSKYLITENRKIVQPQITYLETFRRFIYLLRKAQFLWYCASIILLLRISQIFVLQIDKLFHDWKSCTYLFTVHRKIV